MQRRNRTDFYIMKAYHLTTSGRKLGLKKIARDEPNCTMLVVEREYGYDKKVVANIIGCPNESGYGLKRGDVSTYTIDTGNGYKEGGRMTILDVVQIRNGEVTDGATEQDNAYTWVMK